MGKYNVAPLQRLVEQFEKLPSIGNKTAQRLAYFVLNMPKKEAEDFANSITEAQEKIHYCSVCCNFTDGEICPICKSASRDRGVICVVETPRDMMAMESTGEFKGVYHILHGAISPLNGVGPDDLTIKKLLSRLNNEEVKEVIMATNPTVEGDATALYLSRLLKPLGIKVTRLAFGVPIGGDLEYADEATLAKSLLGRTDI
ncbi:MAG: recombination mediator RecR [Acutalibacteraceae bacterium]